MDTLPVLLLCPLVPAMCIVLAVLIGGTSRIPRWKLGIAFLAMFAVCSLSVRISSEIEESETLWFAAAKGNAKLVEEALGSGGNPEYRFEGEESAIEIARKNGYEAIARRLERAVQEKG
ncbi:MAG: hypothetical protein ACO1SV_06960 [Fimbriimonas sp.]